ncbi:MAG: acyl-CoA dehydrogenase family protein [Saprospiraceae bacterium]
MENVIEKNWTQLAKTISKDFAKRAEVHDQHDTFVSENYMTLKENGFLSAMIPLEFGGAGISHAEMCHIIRVIAQSCGATALALSMHQHLLAATIWRARQGKGGEETLLKVAKNNLVLVSTGAGDWLESTGNMEKVEGGYLVTAQKNFASQSPVGDVLVTSARYQHPEQGWQVLHFPVSFQAKGLTVLDNWYTMGMRGTGSHTVQLDEVFVSDAAIILQRPAGQYHAVWNTVLVVAMPLIMSAYVGIAEKAAQIALEKVRNKGSKDALITSIIGEMNNELTLAQVMLKDMIAICNNFDFAATDDNGHAILSRKTLVANACKKVVEKAMETIGGQSLFRNQGIERLFRDVQGAPFHPLPEKPQWQLTGAFLLESNYLFKSN